MTHSFQSRIRNRLLAALPREDIDHLWPHLETISLSNKQILYSKDSPIERVYFIEQGVVSVLTVMTSGRMGEVGMIGCEGIAGVPVLLGTETSAQQVLVQIPGTALCIGADFCKAAFDQRRSFRTAALRFIDSFLNLGAS